MTSVSVSNDVYNVTELSLFVKHLPLISYINTPNRIQLGLLLSLEACEDRLQFVANCLPAEGSISDQETYRPEVYGQEWLPVLPARTKENATVGLKGATAALVCSEYRKARAHPP